MKNELVNIYKLCKLTSFSLPAPPYHGAFESFVSISLVEFNMEDCINSRKVN
jgi:hypothetical protein